LGRIHCFYVGDTVIVYVRLAVTLKIITVYSFNLRGVKEF